MKKAELEKEKKRYLRLVKDILNDTMKFPNDYDNSSNLSLACRHLATYSELDNNTKEEKRFKQMKETFEKLSDSSQKKLCKIEVLGDSSEKFVRDESIEGKRYICVVPSKKKELSITKRSDGITTIEFWNTRIEVPSKIVNHYTLDLKPKKKSRKVNLSRKEKKQ